MAETTVEKTKKRMGGVNPDSFLEDVQIWDSKINRLPEFCEDAIREEVLSWDTRIPNRDCFDFESLYEAYSNNVAYRDRITELFTITNAHSEMASGAQSALETAAKALIGGVVKDKEAYASYVTQPFTQMAMDAKRVHGFLTQWRGQIEYASQQLARLLREREALGKINHTYDAEGKQHTMNTMDTRPTGHQRQHKPFIRTRKSGLRSLMDEAEEIVTE